MDDEQSKPTRKRATRVEALFRSLPFQLDLARVMRGWVRPDAEAICAENRRRCALSWNGSVYRVNGDRWCVRYLDANGYPRTVSCPKGASKDEALDWAIKFAAARGLRVR